MTIPLSLQFHRTAVSFYENRHITLNGNLTLDCKCNIEKGCYLIWNCFSRQRKTLYWIKTFHFQIRNLSIHFQDSNVQMQSIVQVKVFLWATTSNKNAKASCSIFSQLFYCHFYPIWNNTLPYFIKIPLYLTKIFYIVFRFYKTSSVRAIEIIWKLILRLRRFMAQTRIWLYHGARLCPTFYL